MLKRRLQAAMAVALASGAMTGIGVAGAPPAVADAPAGLEQTARFEVDFLIDMIDHHAMAVGLAETCLENATHEELSSLCQSILETQQQEIQQMQTWLSDWYGITHVPQMTEGDMRSMEKLAGLSGAAFEIRFMESMIRHHWRAVGEAEKCFDNAEHQELIELCSNIRDTQLAEIVQMQTWLEEWYDRSGGRPVSTV
jgi:uncharacterized protein (DUF305 family)